MGEVPFDCVGMDFKFTIRINAERDERCKSQLDLAAFHDVTGCVP